MWNTLDVLASGSSQLASSRRPSLQLFPGVPDFAALGEVEQDGEKLNGAAKHCYHSRISPGVLFQPQLYDIPWHLVTNRSSIKRNCKTC